MLDLAGDDARRLENTEVLGDRRLREAGFVNEVAADAGPLGDQRPDDPDPGWMSERSGQPGQGPGGILLTTYR
jgi:hypothetical protein